MKYMNLKIINLYQSLKLKSSTFTTIIDLYHYRRFPVKWTTCRYGRSGKDTLNGIIEDERTFIT